MQRFQFHALFHLTSTIGPWCMITHIVYAHYDIAAADAARVRGAGAGDAELPAIVYVAGVVPVVALKAVGKAR